MTDLKISLIQSDIFWEEPQKNKSQFEAKINTLADKTDLIILPEMFSTGFTMNVQQYAESMQGATVSWMKEMSIQSKTDIVGSVIIQEDGKYFNRLLWVKPDKQIFHYDKRHLFQMAGEDKNFSPGSERIIVELNGWKILPLICYDLRFPIWARNRRNEYDLLIYVANWPQRRITHWNLLLQTRAVENQCYVTGVNRIGKDGNEINHTGESTAVDYLGNPLSTITNKETTETITLSYSSLIHYRNKFPIWKDADDFHIL